MVATSENTSVGVDEWNKTRAYIKNNIKVLMRL